MQVELEPASEGDAAAIAALRHSVAHELTKRYGHGAWSATHASIGGVEMEIRTGELFVVREAGFLMATLRLSNQNPWIGNTDFFTERARCLYLTSMAVRVSSQRQGIGRGCVEAVKRKARESGAGAIRLDAFDAPAGAGQFYKKCGFREVRRDRYFDTALIWFELLL